MSTSLLIRERLIRLVMASSKPVARRTLVLAFDVSRRAQAEEEISNLVSANVFVYTGRGTRGSPTRVGFSGGYDQDRCKLCGQIKVPA